MANNSLADSPVVVYGAPRSGTTYLIKILNEHPEIFISHETRLFAWLHHAARVLTQKDQFLVTNREEFTHYLESELPSLIRTFYRSIMPAGTRYWGDKNPHYADPNNLGCLDTAAELFPGSRFIHIIRDGRDVVASLLRKRDQEGRGWVDFQGANFVWTRHLDIGCTFGASLTPDRYMEVKYEELIADDFQVAERMLEFLGIDMHSAIESFCRSQNEKRTPFSGPTRDLESGAGHSQWTEVLSTAEQLESLKLIGDHIVRHGYETDQSVARLRDELARAINAAT